MPRKATASPVRKPTTETSGLGRPIEPDDLFNVALVSDPRLSPDGKQVAYVVTWLDKAADNYQAAIWLLPLDGGEPRQLTAGASRDTTPRWSPDGKQLAFVSNRSPHIPAGETDAKANETSKPKPQIWLIPVAGGEAKQLTNQQHGAGAPAWAPDGKHLAFISTVETDDATPEAGNDNQIADERIIDHIRYRHDGRGFVAGKYNHVWSIPVTGGEATQLTFGDVDDDQIAWSPDGRVITFQSNRSAGRELNSVSAIYAVPAHGGEIRTLAEADAVYESPAWSPDGRQFAMLGFDDAASNGKITRVFTAPATGESVTCRTVGLDLSFSDEGMSDLSVGADQRPIWSADGKFLYLLASDRGSTHIQRLDLESGQVTPVTTGDRRVAGFTLGPDDRIVFLAGDLSHPFELFSIKPDGSDEQQLTHHNQEWLETVSLDPGEWFEYPSTDGAYTLQGWLLKPPAFRAGVAYPAIVQIHGGPHAMYGNAIFHEMQLMAARGYVVLFTNPRGSAGYGEAFSTSTRGDWGESDMPDVMAGVDALVTREYVDPERIGVTGGSYGGYLTNWLVGHTDRFRAAVTQRCLSNMHSMYGTSDIGFDFGEVEFGGVPWADAELLLRHSPISYVDRITTPLLIIHNEGDLRCPIEQAEQLFVALKRLGKTTSFVRIPEEDHNLSRSGKPSRRLARLHHLIGWFDRHL